MDVIASEELVGTRDGVSQLQRRWQPKGDATAAVVLVHGVAEHSGRYHHVGQFLAARGLDVLGFDLRGHGQTGGRRGHVDSFEQFYDDVEDLIIERRQTQLPTVLIGHSLGGLISSGYVVSDRPTPDLLVLSAPALGAKVPRWQRIAAPLLSNIAPTLFIKSDLGDHLLSRDPQVQQDYSNDELRVGGVTTRLGSELFSAMELTTAGLERITMPTYVLHGQEDKLVPPSFSEPLSALPNVTRREWPGLRHECLNEPEQAEVMTEMVDWIDVELAKINQESKT